MKNWRVYYERNRAERSRLLWHGETTWKRVELPEPIRTALIASLATFEVGESGEGKRLKAGALTTNDPDYCRAIELFLNEEHDHAAWLGKLIDALGGEHLRNHWSDGAFVFLRHMGGLQTELLLLLAVEMIAQAYYSALRDGVPDEFCREVFARICDDEDKHVAFHVDFLRKRFARQRWIESFTTRLLWYGVFRAACVVVMMDHAPILRAVRVSPGGFWQRTGAIFRHTSSQIWETPAIRVVERSRL
ncbi:MAG: ferritin-like domain-containing protein [Akkermansiaceae bacterium]|nr:ferritin-like domain-containing protein [Armatimonadota bacterium]